MHLGPCSQIDQGISFGRGKCRHPIRRSPSKLCAILAVSRRLRMDGTLLWRSTGQSTRRNPRRPLGLLPRAMMARRQWGTAVESAGAFSTAPASSPNEEAPIVLNVDSITKQCTDPAVPVTQIKKSGQRIDGCSPPRIGGKRKGSLALLGTRRARPAHPSPKINASVPRCDISCTTAVRDGGVARRTQQRGQGIHLRPSSSVLTSRRTFTTDRKWTPS